jgi:hypothetical protein
LVAMARRPTWSHTSGGRAPLASPSEGKGVYSPWRIPLDRVARTRNPSACGPAHPQPSHPACGTLGGAARWSWWLRGEKGKKKIGGKGD